MNIQPILGDNSRFDKVILKTTNPDVIITPHCIEHGAMNKITKHQDGGGLWRCLTVHSRTKIQNGKSFSYKENEGVCRAGCEEKR